MNWTDPQSVIPMQVGTVDISIQAVMWAKFYDIEATFCGNSQLNFHYSSRMGLGTKYKCITTIYMAKVALLLVFFFFFYLIGSSSISVSLVPVMSDFVIPWTAAHQASLSITNSWSLLKLMFIELVIPSNHFIFCCPLLQPSIFTSIRVFSNKSVLCIRWPNYWRSASASFLPMNI